MLFFYVVSKAPLFGLLKVNKIRMIFIFCMILLFINIVRV